MKGRIVIALVLVVAGVAWALDLQGRTVFPGGFATWWPSILILVGIVGMLVEPRGWRGSFVLVVVGAVLQAWTLGYVDDRWWAYLAPAALILVGILILLPPYGSSRAPTRPSESARRESAPLGPEDVAIFAGRHMDARAGEEYKGGELTAVFGNLDADLRAAKLPQSGARLKATSVFGGVSIRVPPEWRVEVHGTPVMGRTENRTHGDPSGPKLDVEAVAVFGAVEVLSS